MEPEDILKCRTLGFLLANTKESIKLVQSISNDEDRQLNGIMTIPKRCVCDIKII